MTTTCATCGWPVRDLPTASAHHTSQGTLHYRRCVCGSWLVLLDGHPLTGGTQVSYSPLSHGSLNAM